MKFIHKLQNNQCHWCNKELQYDDTCRVPFYCSPEFSDEKIICTSCSITRDRDDYVNCYWCGREIRYKSYDIPCNHPYGRHISQDKICECCHDQYHIHLLFDKVDDYGDTISGTKNEYTENSVQDAIVGNVRLIRHKLEKICNYIDNYVDTEK